MSNVLGRAADAVACDMLRDIGQEATKLGVWTMWTPKIALVPFSIGALSYLANRLLCEPQFFDPDGGNDERIDGCRKGPDGMGFAIQYTRQDGVWANASPERYSEIIEVKDLVFWNGGWGYELEVLHLDGNVMNFRFPVSPYEEVAAQTKYRLGVPEELCQKESDPDSQPDPNPEVGPYEWTDPETNCNYTLIFEGFAQITPDGEARPVWTISSAAENTRASGGVIGGCNLAPTIYVQGGEGGGSSGGGGGDGPIPPIPYPPNPPGPDGDGIPWWVKAIAGGATGALLNQIMDFLRGNGGGIVAAGQFTLVAPCDVNENGDNLSRTWDFAQLPLMERLYAQQVALMEMMQQHLNWKTPTCGSEKPELEGTWISTRWISDGNSPGGERPLRKLFRYRSKSTLTDEQLRDYWADFSWQAGSTCVIHKGAWWGTPQVWASTPEEGKRVLRFAGAEAGLDPDQAGEWVIGSSDSARYGMSGTMRLESPNGTRWVTRRDGPSSVPA